MWRELQLAVKLNNGRPQRRGGRFYISVMGLDSVELIVRIEKFFALEIPDPVAERLRTVGDVTTWLGEQLGTSGQRASATRDTVAAAVRTLLTNEHPDQAPQLDASLIIWLNTLEAEVRLASQLFATTGLEWPNDAHRPRKNWLGRLVATDYQSFYQTATIGELVNWLVARNYERLLQQPLRSQYEVEQAVIGLSWEQTGVEIPEIQLASNYVNDLGVD